MLDRLLADANALAWGTAATFVKFFRKVEQAARRWLDHGVTRFAEQRPAPDATLEGIRAEGERLKQAVGIWNMAVHEHSTRISRLLGQPAPSIVGTKAHKDRMADAQSSYNSAEMAQKEAADAYKVQQDRARLFEDELAKRQARWDAKMDTIANKWLVVATAALGTMKRFPRIVQYGPEAVFSMGMTHHGKPAPQPKFSDDDDYTSGGPRGPK